MKITFTVTNNNPNTIWNKLAKRLGREPTRDEAVEEVKRLLLSFSLKRNEVPEDCYPGASLSNP